MLRIPETGTLKHLTVICVLVLTAVFCYSLLRFTVQPGLASFADDSVSYLVMAQAWSPWQSATAAVQQALGYEVFYPPLFPLLLAVLNAAHHFAWAHAVCALLLASCLPLIYLLARRWLQGRGAAFTATVLFALLPGVWLNSKGILSEPLFMLLLLGLLLELDQKRRGLVVALLFCGLALTRTIGCVLALGYIAWALFAGTGTLRARVRTAVPALVGLAAYGLWLLLRPTPSHDYYSSITSGIVTQLLDAPDRVTILARLLVAQAVALADAWSASLMIYWLKGQHLPHLLALAIGAVALPGWGTRLMARRPDAWLMLAYFGLLLLWPYPGQMLRFLLPVLPVIILYALVAAQWVAARMSGSRIPVTAVALGVAGLSVPALTFLAGRAGAGAQGGYAQITEWYGSADLKIARARTQVQLDLFETLAEVHRRTTDTDRIAWVMPGYIALLADRRAILLPPTTLPPSEYRAALSASGATHALLSAFHPHETTSHAAWDAGIAALGSAGYSVKYVGRTKDGDVHALLLQLPTTPPQL
jgi:hypothetical protein